MYRRSDDPITANDTFLWRICKALGEEPEELARRLGVPFAEVKPLLDPLHRLAELDRDEVWWKLFEYVDKRLGLILAVRTELNKALQKDRTKRAVRIAAMVDRTRKGSPRGRL